MANLNDLQRTTLNMSKEVTIMHQQSYRLNTSGVAERLEFACYCDVIMSQLSEQIMWIVFLP